MDWLLTVVRDLAIVAVVCAFIELLLPEGSTRYPVRLVFGLYFIAVLLNPLVSKVSDCDLTKLDFEQLWADTAQLSYTPVASGDEQVRATAEATLAAEITRRCESRYEQYDFFVEVELSESRIERISIRAVGAQNVAERLKDELAADYGVERSAVLIETEG